MRIPITFVLTALLVGASCVNHTHAQGKTDLSFRSALPSARSVALGEAFVADTRDASSAQSNPACLAFLDRLAVSATGGLRTDDRLLRSALTMPVLATERHTLSLGGESALFDAADWTKHTGTMAGAEASYAFRIMESFSLGLVYNFRTVGYGGKQYSGHTGGIGLMYAVLPSLSYGVSFTGFGSGVMLKRGDDKTDRLEKELNVPRSVTFGASWHYPATHDRRLVEVYLSNQSISGEERLVYRLGAEFLPWKFLALRGGIVSGPVTAMGRAGIGIRTGFVDIDYAMASSVAAERLHVVTVTIPLGAQ